MDVILRYGPNTAGGPTISAAQENDRGNAFWAWGETNEILWRYPWILQNRKKIKKYQYAEYSTKLSCFKNVKTQTKIELRKKKHECVRKAVYWNGTKSHKTISWTKTLSILSSSQRLRVYKQNGDGKSAKSSYFASEQHGYGKEHQPPSTTKRVGRKDRGIKTQRRGTERSLVNYRIGVRHDIREITQAGKWAN